MRPSRQPLAVHVCTKCRVSFTSIEDLAKHSNQFILHGLSPLRLSRLRMPSARNEQIPLLKDLAAEEMIWPKLKKLRENQSQLDELESQFLNKRAALETEYQKRYQHLYNQRYEIVTGALEAEEKGVPCFWLNALKNNDVLAEEITKHDEEALKFLKDIKCSRTDTNKGFTLQFVFDTNPFFKNYVLTTTYNMTEDEEYILEKPVGSEIEWYPGKCLTQDLKSEEDSGSFFEFFSPPEIPVQDVAEELLCHMEHDFDIASTIRNEIIPHAVAWFTRPKRSLEDCDEKEYEAKRIGSGNFYYTFDDSPDDEDLVDLAPALSLANMINALNDLTGQHVEEVPSPNVEKLIEIQRQYDELEAEFLEKKAALVAEYEKLYHPLYEKRYSLTGKSSRFKTQCGDYKAHEKGVGSFWLNALKNNNVLAEEIRKADEAPLKFLKDIKCFRLDDPKGFRLEFSFENNPFFQNSVLKKTYHMIDEDEHILEEAIGTEIQWYLDSYAYYIKKLKSVLRITSFFHFFSPPKIPGEDEEITLDAAELILNEIQHDYDIALTIRSKIIPHAFKWFMAKSIQFDDDDGDECKTKSYDTDSSWAELPDDILELFLERLPSVSDFSRFACVCKSWNSLANNNLGKRSTRPMVLVCTDKEEVWNACDITIDEVISLHLEFDNKCFCGVSKGWIISINKDLVVTLTNPFSRGEGRRAREVSVITFPALKLPETLRMAQDEWNDFYVSKATISADPIYHSKDCIVVIIYDHSCQLAFAKLGDTRWTHIDERFHSINDITFVGYKLYAIDVLNQLYSFEVYAERFNLDLEQFNADCVEFLAGALEESQRIFKTRYVVQLDCKQLLMVHRSLTYSGPPNHRRITTTFELFKLEANEHRWTEIYDVGDTALFVGEHSAGSVVASDFGYLPNHIYFVHKRNHVGANRRSFDYGVYNIRTQTRVRNVYTRRIVTLFEESNQTPIWIMGPTACSEKLEKRSSARG